MAMIGPFRAIIAMTLHPLTAAAATVAGAVAAAAAALLVYNKQLRLYTMQSWRRELETNSWSNWTRLEEAASASAAELADD